MSSRTPNGAKGHRMLYDATVGRESAHARLEECRTFCGILPYQRHCCAHPIQMRLALQPHPLYIGNLYDEVTKSGREPQTSEGIHHRYKQKGKMLRLGVSFKVSTNVAAQPMDVDSDRVDHCRCQCAGC